MNSSVLWIFLIAAWLFILLPMVLRGRPEVRKTTEAAANTRLLHRGGEPTATRRGAAGRHPSNPDYVRTPATRPTRVEIEETDVNKPEAQQTETPQGEEITAADAVTEVIEVVDVVEVTEEDPLDEDFLRDDDGDGGDGDGVPVRAPMSRERRGRGYPSAELAERDARRYRERRRNVLGLSTAAALALVACFVWQPYGFILLGVMVALTGLYLFFLRRTAVAEQEYRAVRAARLRRHAAEDARLERQQASALAAHPVAPGRRRPGGMVVLDFDDEDPAFDHLPTYDLAATAEATEGLDADYRRAV